MTKSIFTAIDPNGKEHKRTSDSRTYTHTVVVQHVKAAHMAIATSKGFADADASNYDYMVECAAGTHRNVTRTRTPADFHPSYSAEYVANAIAARNAENAKRIAEAKAFIAKYPTKEAYVAARLAERVAAVEAKDFTIWHNLGWCGRHDLAVKLASKAPGAVILEAVRVK